MEANMKKLVLTAVTTLMAICINAAPALRGLFTVEQPDGTLLSIEQFGDEYHHWTATSDGTLVVNTGHGYYVAQIDETGELAASALLAHEPAQRKEGELLLCREQRQRMALFASHARRMASASRRAQVTSTTYFPHTGSPRCLVILVNFSDVTFSSDNPAAQFEQYFNGEEQQDLGHNETKNLLSVKNYFKLSSGGKFTPQFTIVGPVNLPQTQEYYGKDSGGVIDPNFTQFCKDAVAAVDEQTDFRDYNNNTGDNNVELVCIIYAGYGQSVTGNGDETIWPKCAYRNIETNDGVNITYLNCSPELFRKSTGTDINGIGLFTHEFSHGMGLPDLYQSGNYVDNQGMGVWDLMDYGCYNYNGYAPSHYTAWEREAMGWISMEAINDAGQITGLKPVEEGGKACKIVNPDNESDYIVLENIQQRGANQKAYGHGLLAYHVAYPRSSVGMGDNPNNTAGRPAIAVVPAGGKFINVYLVGEGEGKHTVDEWAASIFSSPFPGTGNVTSLSDDMALPNYCFYEGISGRKPVGYTLSGITEDNLGDISFTIGEATDVTPLQVRLEETSAAYFDLQGRRIANPTRGFYIRNGRKVVVR